MNVIGKSERLTQDRVIALFHQELGYDYLGNWAERTVNSNIEESYLSVWLAGRGYTPLQISVAIHRLRTEANNPSRGVYQNNKEVYNLLRYGVPVKTDVAENTDSVWLVDWDDPDANDFAIAEEVTLKGNLERRPDIIMYVNGIAIGVLELKKSRTSIGHGIRQNLSNQQPEFNEAFFSTVQFVLAGNDTEGLRYGALLTPEKFFMSWKEDEAENAGFKLDKYLRKMFRRDRLIELMHDFVLFDGGAKKLPRVHQYFGIKAAQQHVRDRRSGIIWHTQGSGKSIVMVLLAKWILENNPRARVAVITDRDELDKQIEGVFGNAGEDLKRTSSGKELMKQLSQSSPRLICSLVHKFGRKDVDNFEAFIIEIESQPTATVGEIFVFVDECHRTQSGRLHRVMKAMMPDAVFIGFTGTPLLKKDRQTSLEIFGGYIHTYKFDEAVDDGVVLDLAYDPRDIDQKLGSKEKIDQWFAAKTNGLNSWKKDEIKAHWATMQNVLSSKSRMSKVVTDIVFDFATVRRLSSGSGNAILVASSIYEACKYFLLFQETELNNRVALVTSYNPQTKDITLEETGANSKTDKEFIFGTYTNILKKVDPKPGMTKTEAYEEAAKERFLTEPANMKLLIVVNKLLTGFDAPSCSVLYIDKSMQDHGLFQAICRTNRLDTEDKEYGTIVDYKDLFKKVKGAMSVYTSELDDSSPGDPPDVLIKDRLVKCRERLDNALETILLLCEPVEAPMGELEYIHYFCGNSEISSDLEERAPLRVALYKATVSFVRAMADIADDMEAAGYTAGDVTYFKELRSRFLNIRDIVKRASGEDLDLKPYEADMRHLIDTYIQADDPRRLTPFGDMTLLQIIDKIGMKEAIRSELPGMSGSTEAIAETIENNVRKKLIQDRLQDPVYFDTMSAMLSEIIAARKSHADDYEKYLKRLAELAKKVQVGFSEETPSKLDTPAKRALWNNLGRDEELALKVDAAVREKRPEGWRGMYAREQTVKNALYQILQDVSEVERMFPIVVAQDEY